MKKIATVTLFIMSMVAANVHLPVASAQTFPSRPIRFVVPYAPGGGADIVARAIGLKLSASMGQPVIVDNRPGGGTIIGTEIAAVSAPDGYTLFMATGSHTSNPSLYKKLPYDTESAFAPVSLVASSPFLLVVNPDLPVHSVAELVSYAKTHKLNYGLSAYGAPDHLGMELLKYLMNIDVTPIPYKGAGLALTDLIGGQIQVMFVNIVAASSQVQSGRVRALAVSTIKRSELMPALPTIAESVAPGFDVSAWSGVLVRAGTPPEIIARLQREIVESLNATDVREQFLKMGAGRVGSTPSEFGEFLALDTEKWRHLVEKANIQVDR